MILKGGKGMKKILALQKVSEKNTTNTEPNLSKQSHFSWLGCGLHSITCINPGN